MSDERLWVFHAARARTILDALDAQMAKQLATIPEAAALAQAHMAMSALMNQVGEGGERLVVAAPSRAPGSSPGRVSAARRPSW
jgi:hypothetical protein